MAFIIYKIIAASMYEFCTDPSTLCACEPTELIDALRRSENRVGSNIESMLACERASQATDRSAEVGRQ